MTIYVALLRAVNVGGTGKLAMSDLVVLAEKAGFAGARTYIASGNLVFRSDRSEAEVKAALERALEAYAGKPVGMHVRTAAEMAQVLKDNPFPDAEAKFTVAIFLNTAPPVDLQETVKGRDGERVAAGKREIYVDYGKGMGRSKLKIPAAAMGTARNMNTVAKLVEMVAD